jgi:hypothetical protein
MFKTLQRIKSYLSLTSDAAGFIFSSLALFSLFVGPWIAKNLSFYWLVLIDLMVVVITGLILSKDRFFWVVFFIASITQAMIFGSIINGENINTHGFQNTQNLWMAVGLFIFNGLLILARYRIGFIYYLLIPIAIAYINILSQDIFIGIISGILAAVILLFLYCPVKFVHDYSADIKSFLINGSVKKMISVFLYTLKPWILGLLMIAFGYFFVKDAIFVYAHNAAYNNFNIILDPNTPEINLKANIHHTLNYKEEIQTSKTLGGVSDAIDTSKTDLSKLSSNINSQLDKLKINKISNESCNSIHWTVRWILFSVCEYAFKEVNSVIESFNKKISKESTNLVSELTGEALKNIDHTKDESLKELEIIIKNYFNNIRYTVDYIFIVVDVFNFFGVVFICSALVSLFIWFAFRIAHHDGSYFQLQSESKAVMIKYEACTEKDLSKYHAKREWFLTKSGFHKENIAPHTFIPEKLSCIFARVINGKYSMDKVIFEDGIAKIIKSNSNQKFVFIEINSSQSVVFKMHNLAGLSSGVKLQTKYSMHHSTVMLKLGRFYNVASGTGYIILLGNGSNENHVIDAGNDNSMNPISFLAWDVNTEFSIDQSSKGFRMWIDDPNIKIHSHQTVIKDLTQENQTCLGKQILKLIRFIFIPI